MIRQFVPLAAAVVLSGCALKGDVRRVERAVASLRGESARADSVRAVEVERLITLVAALHDSLGLQQRRLAEALQLQQGAVQAELLEVQRQLVQLQELTGQSQQRLSELRRQLEQRAQQPVPVEQAGGQSAGAGGPGPTEMFELSLQQLRRGSPSTARAGFRMFLEQHPTHDRVVDAVFFIGESWGAAQPDSAAPMYERVARDWPDSPRAPSALYKLGLLAEQRGDAAQARTFFQRVLSGYPRSEEAALARDRLGANQE
ncbi:MAG: tetratricopeptide repeat protein [Gemmatimonadales bacterium]